MKRIIIIILMLTTIYCLLNTSSAFAQSKILINEFLIDPQPQSVEVFNSGTESADLSDWIIDDSGGTAFYTIPQNNFILPNQCLVFSADFNLNKSSADTVRLINGSQQLVDYFSYKSSSGSGISYYRFPDNSDGWTTGSATLGFYNQTNISCLAVPTETPIPKLTPEITAWMNPSPTEIETPIQPTLTNSTNLTSIYLSEVMVNPVSGEKEWLEIYNDNDFPVSLNNWSIDDLENSGSSPKIFSLVIDSKSYGVLNLTSSMFNNAGDNVRLLDFNKNLKDSFEYPSSEPGKSLGRTSLESDDFCSQEPTKNYPNNSCLNSTSTVITSVKTELINPSLTIIKSTPVYKPILKTKKSPTPMPVKSSGQVLGLSNETIINLSDNKPLINLLTILSTSYSLLTIISILFRMKLNYGKNKKLYSPPLHTS